uniref:Protein phosphatase 4 regulatory subunit 3 n=1 Tax=Tetraselmis sp. GSL018 TaxID=582737 RepID=A0A061R721_9CHLO|mmetsp:Transcript_25095/g.59803  ORF Transcript_25095/g.59803 Transcript_25095/m.59803 type:complete len:822 (+) Transcript_25095:309-2774(+)
MQNFNMQRVKIYRLNRDGLWDDKGTGHVSMEYMEQSDSVGLVVISEEDTRTLLIHRISREDIYQRQGDDTIITWSDPEIGTEIALSFQEAQGCSHVWGQIRDVQERYNPADSSRRRGAVDEFDMSANPMEQEPFAETNNLSAELPAVGLANLPDIAKVLTECTSFQRENVARQLIEGDYLRKLLDLFRTCEDLEDRDSLNHLYKIVKGAIMLNETALFELLLSEDNVMDVVGALEYDPELKEQQKYREFLRERVVFKEVVPIKDQDVKAKIHQTYRISYIKDVILPRVLDDATFATLASLMLFNNVEVLMALQSDSTFLSELFGRLKSVNPQESDWRDLVAFLQELCSLAKHLQATPRMQLFAKLVDLGMFEVVTQVMKSGNAELRLRGSDILLSTLQHDPSPLRTFLIKQDGHALFTLLVDSLVDDYPKSGSELCGGLQEQVLEMLRMLLDPESMEQSAEKNEFLELFYDEYIGKLVQTLRVTKTGSGSSESQPSPATLGTIVELLCFCVQNHSYRIKYYILRNNVVEKVLRLLKCSQKWLVVAAVRFLRTCIGVKDEFYNRYLVRNNLLEPVVKAFIENGSRYNLLNSAILELVEFIRKENIQGLISHLVEQCYNEALEDIDYVDTFKQLKIKYEQSQERRVEASAGAAPTTSGGATQRARDMLMANRRRRDERGLDKDEEDYFNEDDDDDDTNDTTPMERSTGPRPLIGPKPPPADDTRRNTAGNGNAREDSVNANPLLPLVDYDDDDDDERGTSDGSADPHQVSSPRGSRTGSAPGGKREPGQDADASPGKRHRVDDDASKKLIPAASGTNSWMRTA